MAYSRTFLNSSIVSGNTAGIDGTFKADPFKHGGNALVGNAPDDLRTRNERAGAFDPALTEYEKQLDKHKAKLEERQRQLDQREVALARHETETAAKDAQRDAALTLRSEMIKAGENTLRENQVKNAYTSDVLQKRVSGLVAWEATLRKREGERHEYWGPSSWIEDHDAFVDEHACQQKLLEARERALAQQEDAFNRRAVADGEHWGPSSWLEDHKKFESFTASWEALKRAEEAFNTRVADNYRHETALMARIDILMTGRFETLNQREREIDQRQQKFDSLVVQLMETSERLGKRALNEVVQSPPPPYRAHGNV
jgi:hypothetical protein